ncbi:MAG: chromosome segregation protein ScpA [Blastopirellula sp.]|nr:MAG: chromosome segregation protein ScpA [Blastopirellula sp.]
MKFRVDIDNYRGPLDLLLYLVRKHELDICDIPIALVTEQYVVYLDILKELDIDAVGDFLEMSSILIEIKSKMLLPSTVVDEEVLEDPREQLVERLLEYKRFKDAASLLEDQGRKWQQRHTRQTDDLPPRRIKPADQPIHEVELWDLVSALTRIVRDNNAVQPTNIVYDETPIKVYMQQIHQKISEQGQIFFTEMFSSSMHKSAIIGVFLAVLELVRHHSVLAEQVEMHSDIRLTAGDDFKKDMHFEGVDDYQHGAIEAD